VVDSVRGGNRSDLILKPASTGSGISPVVAQVLRGREDVDTVVEMRYTGARVRSEGTALAALDASGIEDVADLGIRSGSLADFERGTLLLSTTQAQALGANVGDRLVITFPESGDMTATVAATFEHDAIIGAPYVLTLPDYAAHVTSRLDAAILMTTAEGSDPAATKQAVRDSVAAYPNVKVSDPADLTADAQAQVDQLLGLVTALLLLAVIVAVLGIVNTLVLSVVERTRELGLLRAVGASRRQVRAVVRCESVLMALLGAVAGVLLGTGAGVALARSLADEGISAVRVDLVTLVGYVLVAALVGVLAALGPARRASRVDVLRAVTVE
jgi:putative ABC transport system permease protein